MKKKPIPRWAEGLNVSPEDLDPRPHVFMCDWDTEKILKYNANSNSWHTEILAYSSTMTYVGRTSRKAKVGDAILFRTICNRADVQTFLVDNKSVQDSRAQPVSVPGGAQLLCTIDLKEQYIYVEQTMHDQSKDQEYDLESGKRSEADPDQESQSNEIGNDAATYVQGGLIAHAGFKAHVPFGVGRARMTFFYRGHKIEVLEKYGASDAYEVRSDKRVLAKTAFVERKRQQQLANNLTQRRVHLDKCTQVSLYPHVIWRLSERAVFSGGGSSCPDEIDSGKGKARNKMEFYDDEDEYYSLDCSNQGMEAVVLAMLVAMEEQVRLRRKHRQVLFFALVTLSIVAALIIVAVLMKGVHGGPAGKLRG